MTPTIIRVMNLVYEGLGNNNGFPVMWLRSEDPADDHKYAMDQQTGEFYRLRQGQELKDRPVEVKHILFKKGV